MPHYLNRAFFTAFFRILRKPEMSSRLLWEGPTDGFWDVSGNAIQSSP